MSVVKIVLAFILAIPQLISPLIGMVKAGGIDGLYEKWSSETAYTDSYAVTLEKKPGKDFVVLNFTDIQLHGSDVYGKPGALAEATIDKAIKETNPDLITLTGDNGTSPMAYVRIIEVLDSYGIPWAPVMGNHDGENGNRFSEAWYGYLFTKSKNCLFRFGPEGMGVGNYIINIKENGKVIHTLFMMDSHSSAHDTEAGLVNANGNGGYDYFWLNQLDWYKWAVNGIKKANGGQTVESSVFMHIPCIEYRYAQAECMNKEVVGTDENGKDIVYYNAKNPGDFGSNHEWICSPEANNGFFALCKELGSTKNMIAGHDHVNDSSILYDGIRLSYGVKCGSGCYWEEPKNGGSTLTIASDGSAAFAHHYVDVKTLEY